MIQRRFEDQGDELDYGSHVEMVYRFDDEEYYVYYDGVYVGDGYSGEPKPEYVFSARLVVYLFTMRGLYFERKGGGFIYAHPKTPGWS